MKKNLFNKTATILVISVVLAVIIAMALLIYIPAFTAYADDEAETVTTKCIKISVKDLEHNEYAGPGIPVKDFNTDTIIFYLPESYYIVDVDKQHYQIGSVSVDLYYFNYLSIYQNMPDGTKPYIEYSEDLVVETVTFTADENPFPDVRLVLIDNGATIYLDNETILTNDFTIKFIGFDETGEDFYVSATKDGVTKYAMVGKSLFTSNSIPYQARTQAEREALLKEIASTPKAGDIVPNTSKTLRIILIVGICVPAALVVLLLFKPTKGARKNSVSRERSRDEFDYDDARSYRRDDRDYRDDRRDDRDYRNDRRDDRNYPDGRRDYPRDDRRY